MMRKTDVLPAIFPWVTAMALAVFSPWSAKGQDAQEPLVVIRGARVITVSGEELDGAEVVLEGKRIRLVGPSLEYSPSARIIDAENETVMPGLIYARSRWQLPRYPRSGVHGDRSAAKEVYFDQLDLEPLLEFGFTAVCLYPYGTGIPGPAMAYHTAGPVGNRELGGGYLRITMANPGADKKTLRDAVARAKQEIEKVEKARKEWEEKQKKAKEEAAKKAAEAKQGEKKPEDTAAADSGGTEQKQGGPAKAEDAKPEEFVPPKIDPAVLPIVQWLRKEKDAPPLLFELSNAADLLHLDDVLSTVEELPGDRLYLSSTTSTDFHNVLNQLGQRKSLVLVRPWISRLPSTVTRYNLPSELVDAGCRVALLPAGDTRADLEEYRLRVAALVRAGLPREAALKAMTLHAAEVLGLDDRLGSIEKGKTADLIFLDGDPLDPHTQITRVMIEGKIVWEKP